MAQFKITCPECSGEIVTKYPEIMLWELCPRCRNHVWDRYDMWMADVHVGSGKDQAMNVRMRTYN